MAFQETFSVVGQVNHKTANFGLETCPGNAPTGAAWHVFHKALRSAYDWACQVRALSFLARIITKGNMLTKCQCQNCKDYFEFDAADFQLTSETPSLRFGQTVPCPHCNEPTMVYMPKGSGKKVAAALNLIPCRICSNEISRTAFFCFNCGEFHYGFFRTVWIITCYIGCVTAILGLIGLALGWIIERIIAVSHF